jgi:hypothetical protein
MGKVYITQEAVGRNFLPAQHFGELKLLFPSSAQIVFTAAPVLHKLETELAGFSDKDYLLLSGDPLIMALAVVVALESNRGCARCLKWDKQEKTYYEVAIDRFKKGE